MHVKYERPTKAQITRWGKLGQKKHRERESLFIAEGERCVVQIVKNGVVAVQNLVVRDDVRLPADLAHMNRNTVSLPAGDFNRLAGTETPQGILAICVIPPEPVVAELASRRGIVVALDGIQDPGNLGTIIRTAAWFGVSGILAGTGTVDPWHPKVVRSTAGSTGTVPVASVGLADALEHFSGESWEILLLDAGPESELLQDISPGEQTVVVVGNEANGISRGLFGGGRRAVRIDRPDEQPVESLNAALALGISLHTLSVIKKPAG